VAKVKIVGTRLDSNLNRESFNNTASQTIFSFGKFAITSNFDGRQFIDYSNELTTFVKPITLETLNLSDVQSDIVLHKNNDVVLNLDKSDFKSFVRFGSAYEYLRTAVEDIIMKYPASLYISSNNLRGGNDTIFGLEHDVSTNITTFKVNLQAIVNEYGIVYNEYDSPLVLDNNDIRNLSLSYSKYEIWINTNELNIKTSILGYTGSTENGVRPYLTIKTLGNPFEEFDDEENISFHIKPNNIVFEEFRQQLTDFQKYILSHRTNDNEGFEFTMKDPVLSDSGNVRYNDNTMVWTTSDGYNLDFDGSDYRQFLERLLTIGSKYDTIKTDLIARFLTPASIKTYDLTEEGKITKLLRIYGREFDQMRQFIDSLAYINRVTYDKINNAPDQIIANLAKTMGWDYFSLVNEAELVETLLTIDDEERNLNTELLPVEIDIELWRRIIMNTNYFWKTKGTREAIKAMFLMIGIPEPFINITEYVYTVDGRIDPRQMELQPIEFGSETYPFDSDGYPKAPPETSDFYFQLSGNTDGGQAYMNNFRKAGFNLTRTVDNKKSWIQAGEVVRMHHLSPEYFQADSKLVLNTKEVDVALDAARGIEYDVFEYIKKDWEANSTGATAPYSYINVSMDIGNGYTFPLPSTYNDAEKVQGDLEVRFNGILLNGPKVYDSITGSSSGTTFADYIIDYDSKTFTLLTATASTSPNRRDVIQATFIYSGDTSAITGVSVQYVVTRIATNGQLATLKLPSNSRGHVQLTINGIALTRGTGQFNADYIVNPNDSSELVIQNPALVSYINNTPNSFVQVAYVEVSGSTSIEARNEIHRVDSFNSSKFFFNALANRFVYVMNYRARSVENVKVLVDGIALEPKKDYFLNPNNSFEIFLPRNIKFGTIISVYYLIGGDEFLNPVIDDLFGLGDISELSFLQFLELVERKMINARTRKTITDFKGGWYPTLLRIYNEYLKRAELEDGDTLQSNGYTFQNLFPFLRKYNSFFDKFTKQLLSATIITKRSGLLVRNSLFSRQKFTYKRGVAFERSDDMSVVFNTQLNYVGDDGSVFLIPQEATTLTPSLQTKQGESTTETRINNTGGFDIVMWNSVTSHGMEYRKKNTNNWIDEPYTGRGGRDGDDLTSNKFTMPIRNLEPNTIYEYRAYIQIGVDRYFGNILENKTQEVEIVEPSIKTIEGEIFMENINGKINIVNTGGFDIVRGDEATSYGMMYKTIDEGRWNYNPNPPNTGSVGTTFSSDIITPSSSPLLYNTIYQYKAFIVVDSNIIEGNVIEIQTPQIQTFKPDITLWGIDDTLVTETSFPADITIDGTGGANVTKYGIVWTQNSSIGNNVNYTNNGGVHEITGASITEPMTPFNETFNATGLSPFTQTWVRAFAENSNGINYSVVRSITTKPVEEPPIITNPKKLDLYIQASSAHGFDATIRIVDVDDSNNNMTDNISTDSISPYTQVYTLNENTTNYYIEVVGTFILKTGTINNISAGGFSWNSSDDGDVTDQSNSKKTIILSRQIENISLLVTEQAV